MVTELTVPRFSGALLLRDTEATAPTVRNRLMLALAIGLVAGCVTYAFHSRPGAAPDFIYPWTASRSLLAGMNPYSALPGGMAAPFQAPLLYPLTAAIVIVPVVWMPLPLAVAVFMGISALLLAYGVTRETWDRLLLFATAPFLTAVALGQWSPLLTAAALLPACGFLAVAKPNLGLALTIYRPSRAGLIGCALLLALSLLVLPSWPRDWLHSLSVDRQSGTHVAPIATPFGVVLLLALLRWRRPEARLLLVMACVPQLLFFYDQLPLMLVPSSRRESYAIVIPSSVAFLVWLVMGHGSVGGPKVAEWCVMLSTYIPCLIIILRRPNEGPANEVIERCKARWLDWLARRREILR